MITYQNRNFYSPQTFKIVALWIATRPLFVPVDTSTVVPSFNSTVPTNCFSFKTLMLFSFSHWTKVKPILRNVTLSKTVEEETTQTYERSTVEKFNQRWAPKGVFFASYHTGMITWIFWELSLASKQNPLACPIVVSR